MKIARVDMESHPHPPTMVELKTSYMIQYLGLLS